MILRVAALLGLILALYGRTATFEFSYLDDDALIIDDQEFLTSSAAALRAFTRPYFPTAAVDRDHSYYRPLVTASYALDAALNEKHPGGYHLTNVLLHALATVLLFQLLVRRFGYTDNIAFAGALLFAVHPALTEAVAWIPGRNDSLLAAFALGSWLLLPRDLSRTVPSQVICHLFAWLAALFTKETALLLPLLWAAQLFGLERRRWRSSTSATLLGGWLATVSIYVALRWLLLTTSGDAEPGASVLSGLSLTRALANLPSLLGGLGKLALPVDLSVLATPEDIAIWPGAIAVVAIIAAARLIPGIRRQRLAFAVAAALLFLVPGLPASNLLVLENRLYLPAVGVALVACELLVTIAISSRTKWAIAAVIAALLYARSFVYSQHFSDRLTFSRAAVQQSPHSSLAHRNLGVAYHLAGETAMARAHYELALAADAAEPVAHNNLGVMLMAEGRLADAERQIRAELVLHPRYAPAHHNLAQILDATGRGGEAISHWESSLAQDFHDTAAIQALLAFYGPRDPHRAAQLRTQLQVSGAPEPTR